MRSALIRSEDFDLVEDGACTLTVFAISGLPMAMPTIYSTMFETEDDLWRKWEQQGERYIALGSLIARLKELTARAGQRWESS